ncbi:putative Signal-transduction protein with CBS domains [Candidatus Competibacter denitrificans Run_A_D11]|uniref:Signal-transduction protein with CBS domains n=1 Tax=Candidatus Competibacter denitrificans Run_A_D11 TaxID=1400863 RepID=W6M688_9GAMM|nr:CBS domain-containing protein [Candidatus Competibacter denitrificans]CDI03192.1 putative Signal-transduction protein with CBS domains [Candidatus Competibacter denitrificans Run_A_D11]HRC70750.1 CBS domain-containing protein [Candidatus Competibacter denitrificans]
MLQLKEILKNKGGQPVTVPEASTVGSAIRTMNEHRVGSVMVQGPDGEPIGILTERDVVRLYAQGEGDFETMLVKDWMTTDMTTGQPDDSVSEILAIMTVKRFRHLPVIEETRMVGVISLGDLVKAQLEEIAFEAKVLREYISS